jgi:hypothetical protein
LKAAEGETWRDFSHLIFDVTEQRFEFFFELASDTGTRHYRGQVY